MLTPLEPIDRLADLIQPQRGQAAEPREAAVRLSEAGRTRSLNGAQFRSDQALSVSRSSTKTIGFDAQPSYNAALPIAETVALWRTN
jgi:hypothetical protein